MELIQRIAHAHAALADARAEEAALIAAGLRASRVVGVLGEAEVGKTATVWQALRTLAANVIRLDLNGAASDEHVGFSLAKEIARMVAGRDLSLLVAGVLLPARAERARMRLAELLGVDGLDEVVRDWPSGGYPSSSAFAALEVIAQKQDVVLWLDHFEAPSLTPRHPLGLEALLWGIRELGQRTSRLRVMVSGRAAAERDVLGPRAAFHQQGQWLSLDAPSVVVWERVAQALDAPAPRLVAPLTSLTGGHPATMLLALSHAADLRRSSAVDAEGVLGTLVAYDDGRAARAIEHARSLHRLGGQVLMQVAHGQRPYAAAQRGRTPPQEIRKVLNRLRLAGLLRHPGDWTVVNPLVAMSLRRSVAAPLVLDDASDDAS